MNPELQESLMKKLHKQNQLSGKNTIDELDITNVAGEKLIQPLDNIQNQYVQEQRLANMQQEQPPQPKMTLSDDDVISDQPQRKNIQSEIERIEQELGESTQSISTVTARAKIYLDEYGNETFYVDNISNGHIVVSDLDLMVQRGKASDLLTMAALEDLKKSRDLRAMLAGDSSRPMLKRLTPEEYLEKKRIELINKKKIEQLKSGQQQPQNQQNPQPQLSSRIRPTILSKLEKLRLSSISESAHLGMTSIEFVEWALTENLSSEELDFIVSHPNVINHVDHNNIKTALYDKKSKL